MAHRLAPLALVTLATLAAACDPDAAATHEELELRDGEILNPPTRPTDGGFTTGGGHDLPWEVLVDGFDVAIFEYQNAFHEQVLTQAHDFLVQTFLADERNLAECPWICEGLGARWNESAFVTNLAVEYGEVLTEYDREGNPYWSTEVYASGDVGCGCI